MAQAKNIVGIDLGTTNIVVTTVDLAAAQAEEPALIKIVPVLQEFAKSTIEERDAMPSFLFERLKEKEALPWPAESPHIIGEFARERGEEIPDRLVSSAKSWLCNPRIDRREAILPWNAGENITKLSPVDALVLFLKHIRQDWNRNNPKNKLEQQKVVITIPASFDAAARDLTVEAANRAGLPEVILLEEPQAAFYAWISQTKAPWREQVKKGDIVLVVDVGGGTTDFSLIAVDEKQGDLELNRVAVGNHILLGGDNMDLTLAFHARAKLEADKKKINNWQTVMLSHQCRRAKETLIADPDKKSVPLTIAGRGSSVIGGTIKTAIERKDAEHILIDGFFPPCALSDEPHEDADHGFKELNLAYAADAAITRHLAAFLQRQSDHEEYRYPKAVLFNGGVFQAQMFRERLVEVVNSWLKQAGREPIRVLDGYDLSQAVALGAVSYGLAREGKGIRIRGGVSQAYYLGIESAMPAVPGVKRPMKALCVAKMGMEEGSQAEIVGRTFGLVVGKEVSFNFFKSNTRRDDCVGDLIDEMPDDIEETSSLALTLPAQPGRKAGEAVHVTLQTAITEIGTLEIYCRDSESDNRWKLEFNVRDAIR